MPAPPQRSSTPNVPALIEPAPLVRPPSRVPGSRPLTPTRGQERIGEELLHRQTAQEATEILTTAGQFALSRMHATAHGLFVHTAGGVVGRTEALPAGPLRQYVEEWNASQLPAYKRHLAGVLEAGAFAVAEKVEQAFDYEVPEPPAAGFWQRWFGDRRERR
jgi:DNA-binding PucR family transcriptional regulator